jgi:hypothetical protein
MNYARIENNTVVELAVFDSIENRFHPSLIWVECTGSAKYGDLYNNGVFTTPPQPEIVIPPAPTKEELMAELAALTAKINALA